MKKSESNYLTIYIALILAVLSVLMSTFFSAFETSITADERIYQYAGLEYLRNGNFSINFEHPPFSKWFGALIPYFSGNEDLFFFRISHFLLYFVTGLSVAFFFLINSKPFGALVWSLLFFFCPNARALGSLHITDSDVACFVLLAALCFWHHWIKSNKWSLALSGFFIALAILSKFTALLFVPFFLLGLGLSLKRGRSETRSLSWVFFAILIAFLLAYLFHPTAILWYGKGIDAQKLHNRAADHATSFFGQISSHGFWNYYLVSFLAKSSPFHIAAVFLAFYFSLRRLSFFKNEIFIFLIPALALFVYLSRLNVQLGLRYALPGIFLLYLYSSWILDFSLSRFKALFLKRQNALFIVAALIAWDFQLLQKQDYLSYFNFLTPSPARNFADGNNDWGQRLPLRLAAKYPLLVDIDDIQLDLVFSELESGVKKLDESFYLAVGASDLAGLFRPEGFYFRLLKPLERIGAFEIYQISWRQYLQIIAANQIHKRARFQNPSFSQVNEFPNIDVCKHNFLIESKSYSLKCN